MVVTDFLVIGGGVVGICISNELKKRFPGASITVLEKEIDCGLHASGRNSGVLHAGFYYFPDSLKAKFTRLGNRILHDYCEEKNLRINKCGKLVVTKNESELPALDELLRRGEANGVEIRDICERDAREIDPRVKTCGRALWSPTTASVDPGEVMQSFKRDAIDAGVNIHTGVAYAGLEAGKVKTSKDSYQAGYVINAAGLYADRVARDFGFSQHYRILPFKGLYLYSDEPAGSVRVHIYPVPDLRNPFLGVHYTLTVDGKIKIGPTAIPAFWREQYHGLEGFNLRDFTEIILRQMGLMVFSNFDFKTLAIEEMRKYSRAHMVQQATALLEDVRVEHYNKWGKPGIRAQLLDLRTHKLEMDFVLEGDNKSMHVLNAVSPAFTCSVPFSRYVCDQIEEKIKQ